jgi:hypothetical protein
LSETVRVIIGLCVAAAVATTCLVLSAIIPSAGVDISMSVGLSPLYLYFAAAASFIFGFPAYLLGRRLKLINWWSVTVIGSLAGAIIAVILVGMPVGLSSVNLEPLLLPYGLFGVIGAISGFAFWVVWRRVPE